MAIGAVGFRAKIIGDVAPAGEVAAIEKVGEAGLGAKSSGAVSMSPKGGEERMECRRPIWRSQLCWDGCRSGISAGLASPRVFAKSFQVSTRVTCLSPLTATARS